MTVLPVLYNLPYPEFRPHQHESIRWVADGRENVPKVTEQPTGCGKSAVAMAQSIHGQVIVLTKSKNLQTQYGDLFSDCAVLYGRNNYPCVHHAHVRGETAADCRYGTQMSKCGFHDECPYVVAKSEARIADRVALNYAYWLVIHERWQPHQLVLDEAHNLSDIVLDWVGTTITERDHDRWELPDFPTIQARSSSPLVDQGNPTDLAIPWLSEASQVIDRVLNQLSRRQVTEAVMRQRRAAEAVSRKLDNTLSALQSYPGDHWYIRSGDNVTWQGTGFICKPLTARYDAPRFFFVNRPRVLAMSATIGNPETFAEEIGIPEYSWLVVPNQWASETRQVHILDVPSMGHIAVEKNPLAFEKQADEIAKAIKNLPDTWSGLVLVTRKHEATLLAKRLAKRGLENRVWVTPGADQNSYVATHEQVAAWDERRAKVPNSICVCWSMWEGYNGVEEKFVILAKCFTDDVRLFGPHGYIDIDSAEVGQMVFAVTNTGEMVTSKITNVTRQSYDGPVYTYKSTFCDMSVTPNHDILIYTNQEGRRGKKEWMFHKVEAGKIGVKHFSLPTIPGSWNGNQPPLLITFEQYFDDETLIWYRPSNNSSGPHVRKENNIPDVFQYEGNRRMFVAKWGDLKDIWTPDPTDRVFFQDKPQCCLVPFFWNFENLIELAGWFVTEGHSQYCPEYKYHESRTGQTWRVCFTQNSGHNLESMKQVLDRMSIQYSVARKGPKGCRLSIHSKVIYQAFTEWFGIGARNKKLPRFLLDLDTDSLHLLLYTMIRGDGGRNPRSGSLTFTTSSEKLKNAVCEIALKIKLRPSVSAQRNDGSWVIGISEKKVHGTVRPKHIYTSNYNGIVWCVQTEHGTVLAGRNGKFVFAGNCPFPFIAEDYERARMSHDGRFFLQRAAYMLEQGAGRCRRGEAGDYNVNGQLNTYVAIADGSWVRIKKYLSQSLREAIVKA